MNFSELLERVNLPDLIAQEWGPEAVRGLTRERGGKICDRRPGQEEKNPSFSVYRRGGVWRWKRHGGDGASGSAYDFLLACGYLAAQARAELHRLAGVPLDGWPDQSRPSRAYTPPSPLAQAQSALSTLSPLTPNELDRARRLLAPLTRQDRAAQDLRARGLWGWPGLRVGKLRRDYRTRDGRPLAHAGALGLLITGPDGQPWGLKVRNLGCPADLAAAGLGRYVYRLAQHGAPAWCAPGYGQGAAGLIVEGELNGAAAARALKAAGLALNVQGLAGAGGLPHLAGMAGQTVYLYADADQAGRDCVTRVGQLAQAAGAAEVRVLPALPAGDFCDLAGQCGVPQLGQVLRDLLQASTIHHTVSPSGESDGATGGMRFAPPHQTLGSGAVVQARPEALALAKYRTKLNKRLRGLL